MDLVNHSKWCCCFGLGRFQHRFSSKFSGRVFCCLFSSSLFSFFFFSVMRAVTYYSWGVVPLPSKASTVSPKLLPSWAIFSFGYLSVIAPLWSLREANHLLWPRGSNGHRASDPLLVRERRRDRERPAPIRRRNNTARAAQFHLPFHPILWKLFINNSFLSHTGAPGEGRRGYRQWGRRAKGVAVPL